MKNTAIPTPTGSPVYTVKCIGTVISSEWILTEDSCVKNIPTKSPSQSEAIIGEFKTKLKDDNIETKFDFPLGNKVFIDSDYIFISIGQYLRNNQIPTVGAGTPTNTPNQITKADFAVISDKGIALLHLTNAVILQKYARLLSVGDKNVIRNNMMGVILGITDSISEKNNVFQGILPIQGISKALITTGYMKSKDVFANEYGTPLFISAAKSQAPSPNNWYQIGVLQHSTNGYYSINEFINFANIYDELVKTNGFWSCNKESPCTANVTFLDWIVAVNKTIGSGNLVTGLYNNTNYVVQNDTPIDTQDPGFIKYDNRKCDLSEYINPREYVPLSCPTPTPTP